MTTFSASDFGRTFASNGDGTDHGWGGHHFVMGGAVRGGDPYGHFPTLRASANGYSDTTNNDQLRNGVLLPSASVDQLVGTLGRWFGLSQGGLDTLFPNLKHFNTAQGNMAFLSPKLTALLACALHRHGACQTFRAFRLLTRCPP